MNLEKLKDSARKFEQKQDWRRAIEVYQKAVIEYEAGHDPNPDLSIYNKVGDLYIKANDPAMAVQAYERAVDLYSEQGFVNNAIALCGKILRMNPGRVQVYLKLAQLHARKNVVIEAKKNLLEYLERMNGLNQLDEAFKALKAFADQFPDNQEIRLMLSDLLRAASRTTEAREQLEKLTTDLEAKGDSAGARKTREKLQAIAEPEVPAKPKRGDLVFLDVGIEVSTKPQTPRPPSAPPRRATVRTARPTVRTTPVINPGVVEEKLEDLVPEADLDIETSSLVDEPVTIEEIASEEQTTDLLRADDAVPAAPSLGFEQTIFEGTEAGAVEPVEGLVLDTPDGLDASTAEDLRPGLGLEEPGELELQEGLDIEFTTLQDDASSIESAPGETPPDLGLVQDDELGSQPPADRLVLIAPDTGEPLASPADIELDARPDPMFIRAEPAAIWTEDDLPPIAADVEAEGIQEVEIEDEVEVEAELEPEPPGLRVSKEEPVPAEMVEETSPAVRAFLDVAAPILPTIDELEERVLDDPDSPETHRALGEALLAQGDQARGLEELDLAMAAYESREDWEHALDLVNELTRVDPSTIHYYQKRVELSFRTGDKARLIEAYLELGDSLVRSGALDKAVAVYRRVLEHEPHNPRASTAVMMIAPPEEPAPPPPPKKRTSGKAKKVKEEEPPAEAGDFIDLGSFIMGEQILDTRMRVGDEEPTGDEEQDFQVMLKQFKRGIEKNIDSEDFQAHYDLGVAFKEMGLLDEAIAEFQKALRSPDGRLRTSEALGVCFYDKGQHAIAEAILRRAVDGQPGSDDEKVGLLYWLGRALEIQAKAAEAKDVYRRVLAVDITFADTGARMKELGAGRKG